MSEEQDASEAAVLAERIKLAYRRVRDLPIDPEDRARVAKRLIALTDASKHDVGRAAARLDLLLADLDAGVVPVHEV